LPPCPGMLSVQDGKDEWDSCYQGTEQQIGQGILLHYAQVPYDTGKLFT